MATIVGTATTGNNGASDTTVSSAAKSTTAGNALLVAVLAQEGAGINTITSVTDTAGNTYSGMTLYGPGGGGALARWFVARNITANASNVVTATFSGNNRYKHIIQIEVSGLDNSALVQENGAAPVATATASAGNITLSSSGIILAACSSTNDRTWSPGSGYTEINDWGTSAAAEYQIVASGTYNPDMTASGSSNLVIAAIGLVDTLAPPPVYAVSWIRA